MARSIKVYQGRLDTHWLTAELSRQRSRLKFLVPGEPFETGVQTELAIADHGLFQLREPSTGRLHATRAGLFEVDPQGYVVSRGERFYPVSVPQVHGMPLRTSEPTIAGLRLQGYAAGSSAPVGDLRLDPEAIAAGAYRFETDGRIVIRSGDGQEMVCGQILLQDFDYPHGLTPATTPDGTTTRIVYTDLELGLPQPPVPPAQLGSSLCSGMLECIRSDDDPIPFREDNRPRFWLVGMADADYRLEASADLVMWKVVSVCRTDEYGRSEFFLSPLADPSSTAGLESGIAGTGWVSDPFGGLAPMGPRGFYRAVRLP